MAEDEELDLTVSSTESNYTGDDIVTLDWKSTFVDARACT